MKGKAFMAVLSARQVWVDKGHPTWGTKKELT